MSSLTALEKSWGADRPARWIAWIAERAEVDLGRTEPAEQKYISDVLAANEREATARIGLPTRGGAVL